MVNYTVSESDDELRQILALQKKNLPVSITPEELQSQGFVTVNHTFDLLKSMNSPYPHIIAKDGERVVGYALVMRREFGTKVPELFAMFGEINRTVYQGEPLSKLNYFVMGQVCVEKEYRGMGLFEGLYQTMKEKMSPHFPCIVTEVSTKNQRSLKAHLKVGFENIREYNHGGGDDWVILLWDWR